MSAGAASLLALVACGDGQTGEADATEVAAPTRAGRPTPGPATPRPTETAEPDSSATAVPTAEPQIPDLSGVPGLLGFYVSGDQGGALGIVSPAGNVVERLEFTTRLSVPRWAPDGSQVAFIERVPDASRTDGKGSPLLRWYLTVVNVDGSNLRRLFEVSQQHTPQAPVWSPDGARVVVRSASDPRGEPLQLYVVSVDGSSVRQLTNGERSSSSAAWSPDGQLVAFASRRNGNRDIFIVSADGGEPRPVTRSPANDSRPNWLPDGRIVFLTDRDGDLEIYAIEVDGSGASNLTRNTGGDFTSPVGSPPFAISPDGEWIAHQSDRDGDLALYVTSTDGSGRANPLVQGAPVQPSGAVTWSPDSRFVALGGIYIVPREGGIPARVIEGGVPQ